MKTTYSIIAAVIAIGLIIGSVILFRSEPPRRADAHDHGHSESKESAHDHAEEAAHEHTDGEEHDHAEGDAHDHSSAGEKGHEGEHAEEVKSTHAEDDHGHGHDEDSHAVAGVAGETIGKLTMTEDALNRNGVEIRTASAGVINKVIELPGEIVLNADKVAHIVPRFPGIVQEVRANLGDRVTAGQVLAVIQSNQSVSAYEIKSLVAGTVIEKHITLGEFVQDDQDIYVVADMSTVWARVSVYSRYLPDVKVGQNVRIGTSGSKNAVTGKIDYIGPIVGERTRTTQARVSLANPSGTWRPGSFVTATVSLGEQRAGVAIPQDAIQTVEGEPVVFVKTNIGFEARTVALGSNDGTMIEILSGLNVGDLYVATNSFLLKAEFGKSEAGHEH